MNWKLFWGITNYCLSAIGHLEGPQPQSHIDRGDFETRSSNLGQQQLSLLVRVYHNYYPSGRMLQRGNCAKFALSNSPGVVRIRGARLAFNVPTSYETFIKRYFSDCSSDQGTFRIQNGSQALECSINYSTLKASIALRILATTSDSNA